jgi:hypothetical protein
VAQQIMEITSGLVGRIRISRIGVRPTASQDFISHPCFQHIAVLTPARAYGPATLRYAPAGALGLRFRDDAEASGRGTSVDRAYGAGSMACGASNREQAKKTINRPEAASSA